MGNAVVYRPAYDAEVEYLESTGTQYIDTGFRPDSTTTSFELDISFEGAFVYSGTSKTIIQQSVIEMDNQFRMNFGDGPHQGGDIFFWFGRNYDGLGGASLITNVALTRGIFRYSQGIVSYSGTSVDVNNSSFPPTIGRREGTMCILKDLECYNARLYGVKIWDNNVLVRDFIPVRIDSIGYMYDKVSKKLFSNAGTGNFILGNDVVNAVIPQQRCVLYFGNQRSVGFERIYEEYEWLCGDGTKYIRIKGYTRNEHWTIRTKCRVRGAGGSDTYPQIYGAVYYNDIYGSWALFTFKDVTVIAARGSSLSNYYDNYYDYNYNDVVSIIDEHNNISINNISKSTIAGRVYFDNDEFWLFSTFDNKYSSTNPKSRIADADISDFTITENGTTVLDLIPCKLLQSIPAILDGNGIARQAGECGMWDKVSNKFYGNVANSGTFTVKGPKCYDEYKWLKVYMPVQQVGIYYMNLPLNSVNFSFRRKYVQGNNCPYIQTNGYVYYTDGAKFKIWSNATTFTSNTNLNVGTSDYFQSSESALEFNEESIPIYGYPALTLNFVNASTSDWYPADAEHLTSLVTVDGSVRYVPCKLTHGIPASMDANGISRPAGTCGMWDKVNDVFYGNVASSGSFTVLND